MTSSRDPRLLAILVFSLLAISSLFAQTSTTGAIEGRASDVSGELPGVTVDLRSPSLQGTKTAVTDANGAFRFAFVPPGIYSLQASLDGFALVTHSGIVVPLGRTVTLDVRMSPAAVAEEITVTAEAPVIDVTSATTGANLTSEQFRRLPIARSFYSVAQIAPGTNRDDSGTTFYGSTGAENQYIIDGLNITGVETGLEGKTINFDFIEEVEVKTGGLEAEFGRMTGGVINAITKSGGNDVRGAVFGFVGGGGLRADNQTGPERPRATPTIGDVEDDFDYGFHLGGYILRDRLWFFAAYNRDNETTISALILPLDTPGFSVPAGHRFETAVQRDIYAGKLTFRISDNHSLTASILGDPALREGAIFPIFGPPSTWEGINESGGDDMIARYQGIFRASWAVTAALGRHQETDTIGGPGASIPQFRDLTVTPEIRSGGFGGFQNEEYERDIYKLDLSMFLGNHDLKLGADRESLKANVARLSGGGGQIIVKLRTVRQIGNSPPGTIYYRHRFFVDETAPGFVRDDPTTWQLALPLISTPETDNTSFYIQDRWRILSNLTLNLGLRLEQQNLIGREGNLEINDNFSPRIGLIWDVLKDGRSKLFASYGRFYESIPMDIVIRSFGGEAGCLCYNFSPDPANRIPDPNAPQRTSMFVNSVTPVDPNLEGQYIDEALLGFEYEAAPNLAIGIKGTYRDLGQVIEDFFIPTEGQYFIANPGRGIGTSVTFYDIFHTEDPEFSSAPAPKAKREYMGLELSARKRLSHNFQLYASYLWSKLEGNYDGTFQVSTRQLDPNINSAFDYADFLINAEGDLSNDREHQLKFDGSYTFAGGRMDGFNVGLSARYATGTPLTAMGFSFIYTNWEYFLTPRGSMGRNPDDYEADLHFGYPIRFAGKGDLNLNVAVFNVLNRQARTALDNRYNLQEHDVCAGIPDEMCNGDNGLQHQRGSLQPVGQLADPRATAPNPDFLRAGTSFTAPRSIRLGARWRF